MPSTSDVDSLSETLCLSSTFLVIYRETTRNDEARRGIKMVKCGQSARCLHWAFSLPRYHAKLSTRMNMGRPRPRFLLAPSRTEYLHILYPRIMRSVVNQLLETMVLFTKWHFFFIDYRPEKRAQPAQKSRRRGDFHRSSQ